METAFIFIEIWLFFLKQTHIVLRTQVPKHIILYNKKENEKKKKFSYNLQQKYIRGHKTKKNLT